ncbi:uncharacterized protein rab11fip5a isoform X2 [Anguilla anguilla]|uniref:uncharacterized protein rab11fip5a isoform X2 n=1 Tax=Anguilla anguilla TaxID=7936 RepID=UPI0015A91630|nr:uncharacterized protein rab11fip5a isoform X2 [Anguilla anguilla]
MSSLNVDDEQRWVPTHVQVTVLRGRGLRAKGKNGTSDVYTIIQVGKEKFSTCVVEKTTAPEWKEECSFELLPGVLEAEGRNAYPAGSSDLVLTVMHRALMGLDVFLGQATIPLDKVFQDRICMRNEWYKLHSKTGKKEKERGEVQVTVQFTRNNLTASMYDLSAKDKPLSAFGRLKNRMKSKKQDDAESASAIVPGGVGALTRRRPRLPSDGGGEEEYEDDEGGEGRRSKMRNFFLRGKLRKSSDTRSSTSLGSESSESSSRGGSLSPTAGISVVVSDLSNSPSETSNLTADDSPDHTTHPSPKLMTHKRAFSDEAGQVTQAPPPQPRAVQSLKAQSGALSQSSLCVNGSHVYAAEPLPAGSHATLGLLQKCSPLSRSLQNLTRRAEDPPRPGPGAEGRRWSFDKPGKEEKAAVSVQAATLVVPVATTEPAAEGKKQKKNGRSDSAGKGAEHIEAPPHAEEKHKGWFGSKDSHNKPSSPLWPPTVSSSWSDPSPAQDCPEAEPGPAVGVARERSHLGALGTRARASPNPFVTSPVSENLSEWDESFEAFAAGRLGSQKGLAPPTHVTTLPPEPAVDESSERMKMNEKSMGAEEGSPSLLRRPTKIPVLQGHQSQRFDWTQGLAVKKDLFPPPQIEALSWERSKEVLDGCAPIPFREEKTGIGLFSGWDPDKPLDCSVSSPQFVSVGSLIPDSGSAGQPIVSPCGKDRGEAMENAADEVEQEEGARASASAFRTSEGVGKENDVVGNAPPAFGKEEMHKIASLPQVASEESKVSTYEPDVSLVGKGTNPFFTTIPSHKLSETLLEGQESSTTDALKPAYEASLEQPSTNTKVLDLPQVTTHAAHENLHDSYAHIFDFANSVLPNTDTSSSLSVMIANNTEINNNSTNEMATSPSPFIPEGIMNEMNSKKPVSLFSKVLESPSPADLVDLPIKDGNSLSDSNDGTLHESVSDVSINAAGFLPEEPVSMARVEVPAGSPVQVDKEDKLLLEKDEPEKQRTCAEEALEKEQPASTSTKAQETISQKLDNVPLADTKSDNTLEQRTIALDAPCSDSDLIALGRDPEGAYQEKREGKNANLNVKDSSSTSAEINGSTLSDYLEARDPGPPVSPISDALNFVTAIEASDPGSSWESHDALSSETGIERLPLKNIAGETVAPSVEGGITPSFCTADSSTSAPEIFPLEKLRGDRDVSRPPPKPPRLFQDSVLNEQHMNEYPQPGLGDEAETKRPGTPKDSSTDLFQTLAVGLGPELQQTCPSPLSSERSGFSATTKDGWDKTGAECQNTTFTIMKDELSSGKEVPQFGFSAFDLEEKSDQSWLTSKSYFKVKELDTTHFAVWSADEENAIPTDSTSLDKAILMENSTEGDSTQVLDVGTQPDTSPGTCSPIWKVNEGLGESFLDHVKGTMQQTWTESVEPTWQSLPSLSGLCSTVSQDLIVDLPPEDLHKPRDEEEKQQALRGDPLDSVLFPQLQPSNPFSESDIISLPKGIGSAINPKEELPAEAAPTLNLHPPVGVNPKSSLFLHDCNPQASSTPSLLAETNAQVAFFPSPILPHLPARSTTGAAQASSIAPPSKPPAMIDTPFTVLPQETQTAGSLPSSQLSSPHPVKPLNTAAPLEEKKSEGRSVLVSGLEKLKSTIHPGRAAHQGEPEADRNKALSEGAAPYYHLSHNELVSLLLQREEELERQGAEFERQGALLEKREAELKKMKVQTRDLEDYIDTLLVRIMEQTPTLLQVRSKLK